MQSFKISGQSCNRYRVKTHTQVLKFFGSESFTLHGYGSINTEVRWLSQNRNISVLANDIELTVIVSVKQLTNNQLFKSLLWRTYVSLDQTVVATRPTCPALPYDKLYTNHRVTHVCLYYTVKELHCLICPLTWGASVLPSTRRVFPLQSATMLSSFPSMASE